MNQLMTALVTIAEAKAKWCPETRTYDIHNDVPVTNNDGAMCMGEACMFWRWHDKGSRPQPHIASAPARFETTYTGEPDENGMPTQGTGEWVGMPEDGRPWELDEHGGGWIVPGVPLPPRGYCGKAGHPLESELLQMQVEEARCRARDRALHGI